jgi:hypothetical protein
MDSMLGEMKCGWGEMKSWRDVREVRTGGGVGTEIVIVKYT